DRVGEFDETLPACEDYDLWLRISSRFPIHLIDTPVIIKRGGHDDQLSSRAGLDKFRIKAIEKIIKSGLLSDDQHRAAVKTLKKKCDIYAAGCRKRGRIDEAQYYESLSKPFR
ncbi:MAG: glycosyltransferase family 2 protein, partial [Desulfobacterales bacterium]|nr:glycosyltransferase family 2 protein [Desulfobacterales bacterium]